jgi:hypothetical protein
MTPREAFLAYARGAFRQEQDRNQTSTYLSEGNESLFEAFVESVGAVEQVDPLVELLAMETPRGPRDIKYELWVVVLQRIRQILGGDRDALVAEVLVHLTYGEDDDAIVTWEEARDIYPDDPEVLRVGLLVAAANRLEEEMGSCLNGLAAREPSDDLWAELQALLERRDWRALQLRSRYNPRRNQWFERAARARSGY